MPVGRPARVVLPSDQGLVRAWRDLIDTRTTTRKQFMEVYRVPTKNVGPDGGRALTRYIEYPFQAVIRESVEAQWKDGRGAKDICAKPRQDGLTTEALEEMWERFCRGGGGTGNIFSYDQDGTAEIFRTLSSFKRQTPAFVFEFVIPFVFGATASIDQGGGEWKKRSSQQLELVLPDGNACLLQCLTAGDAQSGSGSAPRWLLWDEFSKWKKSVKADPTAMSEGWAAAPGNFWRIQATGQGQEEFAERFLRAWDAKAARHPGAFVAHFNSWLGHPDRRREFRDPHARAAFVATIGKLKDYFPAYEERLVNEGATPEEIAWYREKIADPAFNFNLDLFMREDPLTPADMFAATALSVFDNDILKTHEIAAQARDRAGAAGEFVETEAGVEFMEMRNGRWLLLEARKEDSFYGYGADCASGKKKQRGTSKETDFSVCGFGEVYTGRLVARLREHVEGDEFAKEIFKACVYFRRPGQLARGYVERNAWADTVLRDLAKLQDAWEERNHEAHESVVLLQQHDTLSDGKKDAPTTGFETSRYNREWMIDQLRKFIRDTGVLKEGATTPFDGQSLQEMMKFERDGKTDRVEASVGHDDCVLAWCMWCLARDELFRDGSVPMASAVKPSVRESPAKQALRAMDERLTAAAVAAAQDQDDWG